ncbi:ABC transporter permease [Saccharibacillus sacchari]|uniref:ABC transporter permease n=1 Tax=Saccharibacillus sacchari TaxID=456493 RepID=A0ACC6PHB8_9BACL
MSRPTSAPAARRRRPRWPAFALLLPALLLMGIVFAGAMLTFARYGFNRFVDGHLEPAFTFEAYTAFLGDPYYWQVIGRTFSLALEVTAITLLLAYPLAYAIATVRRPALRQTLLLLTFMPLLVSAVVKSYAWMILLSRQGFLNWIVIGLGLSEDGLDLTLGRSGVVIALVHVFIPFMVLPILGVLTKRDPSLKAAAHDLGAGSLRVFFTITLPMSARGIASGVQIVFTLCLTAFTIPALIGGGRVMTLPTFIYQRTLDTNWPMAAAASFFLMASCIVVSMVVSKLADRFASGGKEQAHDV